MQSRIELALFEPSTLQERRDLGAIVRSCVDRVDRELGEPDGWFVRVGILADRFVCTIVVHDRGCAIETTRDESDGALAIRDAVGEIEQVLRDVRATRCRRRAISAP